jgi:hypothetical protein
VQRALDLTALDDLAARQRPEGVRALGLGRVPALLEVIDDDALVASAESFHLSDRQVALVADRVLRHLSPPQRV